MPLTSSFKDKYIPAVDENSIRQSRLTKRDRAKPINSYVFCHLLRTRVNFDRNDVPLAFKATPDKLLELALRVLDEIPLPPVFTWSIEDICRWLRQLSYPQYQNTFRVNLINGRTLLLLDASALSAMNIKDFDHIRDLTKNIRSLFAFEMTKFGRSISLPKEYYHELYKLFRVRNGPKYELTRRSDLWRQLHLIRQKVPNLSHWEVLERWLGFESYHTEVEVIGGAPRPRLYGCDVKLHPAHHIPCHCIPPCKCHLRKEEPKSHFSAFGKHSKPYREREDVLNVLKEAFPYKYGQEYNLTPVRSVKSMESGSFMVAHHHQPYKNLLKKYRSINPSKYNF